MLILDVVLVIIVFLFLITVLFVIGAYFLGKIPGGTWFKVMPANSVGVIVRGDTVVDILVNVPGYFFDKDIEEIVKIVSSNEHKVPQKGFIEKFLNHFGISIVSGLWPFYGLYKFKITREKIRSETKLKANEDIASLIIEEEAIVTDTLRWLITRPFLHRSLELSDGGYVDVLDDGKYRLERLNAETLSILMRENFFVKMGNRVDGVHNDLTNSLNYEDYIKVDKGENSDFSRKLTKANTAEIAGYKPVSIWVTSYQESKEEPGDMAKARRQLRLAEEQGKATVRTAKANRDANKAEAEGNYALANVDARVATNLVTALGRDGAVRAIEANADRDGTVGFLGGTLVKGGQAGTQLQVPATPSQRQGRSPTTSVTPTNTGQSAQGQSAPPATPAQSGQAAQPQAGAQPQQPAAQTGGSAPATTPVSTPPQKKGRGNKGKKIIF